VERFAILAPATLGVGFFLVMLVVYSILVASRRGPELRRIKANSIFGPFWAGYVVWLLGPIERALVTARVSPTLITAISLGLCVAAGVAIALEHLATGAWLFLFGGILDMLDGRLARAMNRQTQAGALFDSVADRWAELALFTGYAWYLHDDGGWLLTVMAAVGGSFMVSYTRARGEALGLDLRSGAMQRAERFVLIALGTLVAAWLGASEETAPWMAPALGITLAIAGGLSAWTAIGRWIDAHRALLALEPVAIADPRPAVEGDALSVAHAVAAMRATGEAGRRALGERRGG
jgi:phosphatidylglycerophosphate synthase